MKAYLYYEKHTSGWFPTIYYGERPSMKSMEGGTASNRIFVVELNTSDSRYFDDEGGAYLGKLKTDFPLPISPV